MITITPLTLWIALAAGCTGLVLASLILTAWLDLHPCHLCIFQRLLFMSIAALALVAALLARLRTRRPFGGLALALAGLGVGVATYQSWLQAQPPGAISCVGGQPGLIEHLVEWLGQQVPSLFLATGFCEETELVIFGLSLANWALVSFAACLIVASWALWRDRRANTCPIPDTSQLETRHALDAPPLQSPAVGDSRRCPAAGDRWGRPGGGP